MMSIGLEIERRKLKPSLLAFALALFATPIFAETEVCTYVGDMAAHIMANRQIGTSLKETITTTINEHGNGEDVRMTKAQVNSVVDMVFLAFDQPMYGERTQKVKAIADFREAIVRGCR